MILSNSITSNYIAFTAVNNLSAVSNAYVLQSGQVDRTVQMSV